YNFEKLENPPKFEPTRCAKCNQVINLSEDGYSIKGGEYVCLLCSDIDLANLFPVSGKPRRRSKKRRQENLQAAFALALAPSLRKGDIDDEKKNSERDHLICGMRVFPFDDVYRRGGAISNFRSSRRADDHRKPREESLEGWQSRHRRDGDGGQCGR